MQTKLNVNQAYAIGSSADVLKSCNAVPFALAVKINKCKLATDKLIATFTEEAKLIQERGGENQKTDGETLLVKEYEIEFPDIKDSEFEGIEISGEKEVFVGATPTTKSYRDAYFFLLGKVIL